MIHSLWRRPCSLAKAWIAALMSRGVMLLRIERERGALLADGRELVVVDVDRDHDAAERGRDLRA